MGALREITGRKRAVLVEVLGKVLFKEVVLPPGR